MSLDFCKQTSLSQKVLFLILDSRKLTSDFATMCATQVTQQIPIQSSLAKMHHFKN